MRGNQLVSTHDLSDRKLRKVAHKHTRSLCDKIERGTLVDNIFICKFKIRPKYVPKFFWYFLIKKIVDLKN